MDDLTSNALEPKMANSADEIARRRKHVRIADAENRLEGIFRDAASDPIFEAYIRGEIEVTEMIPRLKAQLNLL